MAAVFAMQGFGQLAAAIVALVTTVAFRKTFSAALTYQDCKGQCQLAADRSWRIIIGFGILPAVFALYYRLTIPETPRFTFDVALDAEKANADIRIFIDAEVALEQIDAFQRNSSNRHEFESQIQAQIDGVDNLIQPRGSWSDLYKYFKQYRNGSVLFATMASWFLLDFSFYGLALNNGVELDVLGFGSGTNVYRGLLATSLGNLILVCAGGLPGYLLTVLTIDSLGRKPIQIGGFAILTVIFLIIGFGYNTFHEASLMGLFILAQLFFNFGPNSTTFVIAAECFPTRYRSTGHGLSAASGKLGAVVIQLLSNHLLAKVTQECKLTACYPFLGHMMQIFAATSFLGVLVTLMLPETKRQTLEVLAGEAYFGTQGSIASRRGKESLLARLTWRLRGRGMNADVISGKGSTRSQENSPEIKSKNKASSASMSSTGRIVLRPIRTRDSEHAIGGKYEDGDISLQEMGQLLPDLR